VQHIFIAGGTGYIGRALIPRLIACRHSVIALARKGSEYKVPAGCSIQVGNALDATTFSAVSCDTFIHLVGTPHPAPREGRAVPVGGPAFLALVRSPAARDGVHYFIFLSIAQPAPVIHAYIQVRAECELIIFDAGLYATVVRPW
jgi:uncharacterized protein YbjT (DUF2867 family)